MELPAASLFEDRYYKNFLPIVKENPCISPVIPVTADVSNSTYNLESDKGLVGGLVGVVEGFTSGLTSGVISFILIVFIIFITIAVLLYATRRITPKVAI